MSGPGEVRGGVPGGGCKPKELGRPRHASHKKGDPVQKAGPDPVTSFFSAVGNAAGDFVQKHLATAKAVGNALYKAGQDMVRKEAERAKAKQALTEFAGRLTSQSGPSLLSLAALLPIPGAQVVSLYQAGKKILGAVSPALFKEPANEAEKVLQDNLWSVVKTEVSLPLHLAKALFVSRASVKPEEIAAIYGHLEGARKDLVQLLEQPETPFTDTTRLERLPVVLQGIATLEALSEMDFSEMLFDHDAKTGRQISGYSGKSPADNIHAQLVSAVISATAAPDEEKLKQLAPKVEALADFYNIGYQRYMVARTYLLSTLSSAAHLERENGVPFLAYYDKVALRMMGSRIRDREEEKMIRALYEGYGHFASLDQMNDSAMADLTARLMKEDPEVGQAWRKHVAGMGNVTGVRDVLYAPLEAFEEKSRDQTREWAIQLEGFKDTYRALSTVVKERDAKAAAEARVVDGKPQPAPGLEEIDASITELEGQIASVRKAGNQWYHFNFFSGKYYVSTATAERMLGELRKAKDLYQGGREKEALARFSLVAGGRVSNYWALRQMDVAANQYAGNLFLADAVLTIATGGLAGKVASTVIKKASVELAKRSLLTVARGRALAVAKVAINGTLFHHLHGAGSDAIFHYGLGWKPQADYDPTDWKGTLRSIVTVGAFHYAGRSFFRATQPLVDKLKEGASKWCQGWIDGARHIAKLASVDIPVMLGLTAVEKLPHWDGTFDGDALLDELHQTVANALIYGVVFGGKRDPKAASDPVVKDLVGRMQKHEADLRAAERLDPADPSRTARIAGAMVGLTRSYENFLGYKTSLEVPITAAEKEQLKRMKAGVEALKPSMPSWLTMILLAPVAPFIGVLGGTGRVDNGTAARVATEPTADASLTPTVTRPVGLRAGRGSAEPTPSRPSSPDVDYRIVTLDHGIELSANALGEYFDVPDHTGTLEAFCRDNGPWGVQARQFRNDLTSLRTKLGRYYEIERSKDPSLQTERGILAQEIDAQFRKLHESWYAKNILDPYVAKVAQVEKSLLPLEGAMASLEVGSAAANKGEPGISYEVDFKPAEVFGGQFENGYARLKPGDLATVHVEVSDWASAGKVVDKLGHTKGLAIEHNTDLAEIGKGHTRKVIAVRLPSGQTVEVRIRVKGVEAKPAEAADVADSGRARLDIANLKPGHTYRLPLRDIIPTQGGVYLEGEKGRHRGVLDRVPSVSDKTSNEEIPEVRVIEGKAYVADGHHRLMAAYALGEKFVEVRIVGPHPDEVKYGLKPVLVERATTWDAVKWRDANGHETDPAVAKQRVVATAIRTANEGWVSGLIEARVKQASNQSFIATLNIKEVAQIKASLREKAMAQLQAFLREHDIVSLDQATPIDRQAFEQHAGSLLQAELDQTRQHWEAAGHR